jgi:hypothetical protein
MTNFMEFLWPIPTALTGPFGPGLDTGPLLLFFAGRGLAVFFRGNSTAMTVIVISLLIFLVFLLKKYQIIRFYGFFQSPIQT